MTSQVPLLSPPLPCGPSSSALTPPLLFMALSLSTLIIFPLQKPFQLPSERWSTASCVTKQDTYTRVRLIQYPFQKTQTHGKQLVNTLHCCCLLSHMGPALASVAVCEAFTGHWSLRWVLNSPGTMCAVK